MSTDAMQLSGEEVLNANPEIFDLAQLETIKNQNTLINKGFIVHVTDCKSCNETGQFFTMKVVLYSSVNGMPVWGDVTLKISKQAAQKFRTSLNITKDSFDDSEETVINSKTKKRW